MRSASFYPSSWLLALAAVSLTAAVRADGVAPMAEPNPLILQDGTALTTVQQWREQRRPELLRLFENEVYGKTLVGRPEHLKFVVRETRKNARGGKATRLRVGVLFEGTEEGRQMEMLVYLPNHVKGRVPLFWGLNFDGNFTITEEPDIPLPHHYVNGLFENKPPANRATEAQRGINRRMWPIDLILERGYGLATTCYGEVEPDMANQWWHGPRVLGGKPKDGDWGAIGAWAWALSRGMDYLETNPRVDARRVAIFGFSRLGKTAMWAGAQDERFAAVISQNSGKGGVAVLKRLAGEPVAHLAGQDLGHWFTPRFAFYSNNEAALPVDGHELAALIAPRPLLILSGEKDSWSDPMSEFLGGLGADPVYRLLGTDGLGAKEFPAPQRLINSTIGYYLRPGGHDVTLEDWQAALDFVDGHLKK